MPADALAIPAAILLQPVVAQELGVHVLHFEVGVVDY